MLLLVGLGNPGPRYAGHRHNVGFMAVDEIVRRRVFSPWRARFNGEVAEGHLGGERTIVLKPMTFMNESSKAVGEAVRYLKVPLDRVVVFHDELDLAPGRVRMKKGGGAGGHNGLRDIDARCRGWEHAGDDYFWFRVVKESVRFEGTVFNDSGVFDLITLSTQRLRARRQPECEAHRRAASAAPLPAPEELEVQFLTGADDRNRTVGLCEQVGRRPLGCI